MEPEVGDYTGEKRTLDGVVGHCHLDQGSRVCRKVFSELCSSVSLTWEVLLEGVHHGWGELLLLVPRHGQDHLGHMLREHFDPPGPKVGTGLVRTKQQVPLLRLHPQQDPGVQGWVHLTHFWVTFTKMCSSPSTVAAPAIAPPFRLPVTVACKSTSY